MRSFLLAGVKTVMALIVCNYCIAAIEVVN